MPERKFQGPNYRFGFNGKEIDIDAKGAGNELDYGMRIYDTRFGRFLSVDPLSQKYAMLTPYQFASDGPIQNVDLDGLEAAPANMKSGTFDPTRTEKEVEQEGREFGNSFGKNMLKASGVATVVVLDMYLTRGRFTQALMASDVYEYTNRNSNQRDPNERAKNEKEARSALLGLGIGWGFSKIVGNAISVFKGPLKEEVKYLFRGTSEGWEGSQALQKVGMTPTSSDPAVATIFAIQSGNYGKGILQIALPQELQGVQYSSNVLQALESEIAVGMKPAEFTTRTSTTITADQARKILSEMGIKLPSKISLDDLNSTINNTPKLSESQVEEFYKRAIKLNQ